jgi:membrane protein
MVLTVGFLLIVSLAVSAVLAALLHTMAVVHAGVSLLVLVALFALPFKFLPDVKIAWRDVWAGAVVTALLFTLGKLLIGLYLGRSSVGSTYGAAGSLIVMLLWVYYSALIFFFGAELTQVWAHASGRGIVPDEHAQPAEPQLPKHPPRARPQMG